MTEAKISWFQRTFGFSQKSRDRQTGQRAGTLPGRHRDHHWASAIAIEDGNWNQPDIRQMARDLQIDEKAERDGKRNIPAPNETAPSTTGTQAEIIALINGLIHQSHASCQHRLTELNGGVTQAMNRLRQAIQRISTSATHHRMQTQQRKAGAKLRIQDADQRLASKERELKEFKDKHQIYREPIDSQAWPLKLGIVLTIIFVEGVINTYFFSQGSELGFLGGAFQALIFAGIDGGIVTILGILAAPIWNKIFDHPFIRIRAITALLIFLLWAVLYNLGVTHYREAFSSLHPEPMAEALQRLVEQNLLFLKFDSYFLFLFGVLLSGGGFLAGFFWMDPVPGYEKLHMEHEEAREELRRHYGELQSGTLDAAQEAIRQVREEAGEATAQHERIVFLTGRNQLLQANFAPYVHDMVGTANTLIRQYQTINEIYRTEPVPEYFRISVFQSSRRLNNPAQLQQNAAEDSRSMADKAAEQQRTVENQILADTQTETQETQNWGKEQFTSEGGLRILTSEGSRQS